MVEAILRFSGRHLTHAECGLRLRFDEYAMTSVPHTHTHSHRDCFPSTGARAIRVKLPTLFPECSSVMARLYHKYTALTMIVEW